MIITTLIRNELIKIRHRWAFWVTLSLFVLINTIRFGGEYYATLANVEREFALPDAWRQIFDDPTAAIGLIFGSSVMILLISGEFSWRTARQNVIDGLTKDQFFLAKCLAVVMIALVFMFAQTSVGGLFALLGTDMSQSAGPIFGWTQVWFLASLFVGYMGYGSLALLAATAIRNSGPAVGSWFFYTVIGEQMLRGIFGRLGEGVRDVVHYAPVASFNRLLGYRQHDPELFQIMVDRAVANGRSPPEALNFPLEYGVSIAWIVAVVTVAFVSLRRRDL